MGVTMSKKNIVVLVSGGGTNLQALIDAGKRGELGNGEITCVISSKEGAYALTRAEENNIKTRTLIRKDYSDIASYSKAMRDALLEEKADLIVYAGFMTILDENVCDAFPNRMINVHPALIPSFWAISFKAFLMVGLLTLAILMTVHFGLIDCKRFE